MTIFEEHLLGTSPHPRAGYGLPRRSPVKQHTLRRLVDAAMGVCQPEAADAKADECTRAALWKQFSAILYPGRGI